MKYRLIASAALLLGAASFVSCIDEGESNEVIDQQDKEEIEAYLEDNAMPSAKEFKDENNSIYVFWEVSVDPEVNDQILKLDTVKVNYIGSLLTDEVFDSSIEQVAKDNGVYDSRRTYGPIELALSSPRMGAIPGFEFAVSLMRVGEKATVIFPSRLGYASSPPPGIPVNSPLVFELELVEVKNGPNHQ
ncbi:FKBP-type peptidyl-prolyl cis-trans isomerase [Algoriphagus terrigena]|uniref:FKBP-type peptidyl-prolyl cis-trans isomerase n=1 Tax=Algoriphagus terrigena TaxID=344884 RepID=UPI000419C3C4|nr:FKBP-type peptidyl-prolyl cis-trans isomerase [Algoriphagus terrigena]